LALSFQNGRTPGSPARTGDNARVRAAAFSSAQSTPPETANADNADTPTAINLFFIPAASIFT
jgi:hypothetical protein